MAWSSVYSTIDTIMSGEGYSAATEPIDFTGPRSTFNSKYSIRFDGIDTARDTNDSTISRLIADVEVIVGYRLSASDETTSYNTFIGKVESIISALEDETNWNKPTSTILYIHFQDTDMDYADDDSVVIGRIRFEIYYEN
jgi:hypothetical protein